MKSIPVKPWIHQLKILRRFISNYPQSAIICDEVGLGKTISASLITRYLLIAQKAKRILILVPASIQPQWHEELREKFNLHFWSYEKGRFSSATQETYQPFGKLDSGKFSMRVSGEKKIGHPIPKSAVMSETG